MDKKNPFHSAKEEVGKKTLGEIPVTPSERQYKLAITDVDFLLREELRPVRLQLELLRTELELQDNNIEDTFVFFGSARLPEPKIAKQQLEITKLALAKNPTDPSLQVAAKSAENAYRNSTYKAEAMKLAGLASKDNNTHFYIVTGGGPGFMEAANRGAHEVGARSIALNMILPNEQVPNPYVTPELTFQFHYFAIRKMHFLMRAKALAAFPGGYGTLDELFEVLTLMQTEKIDPIPLLLFNEKFWRSVINFEALVEQGTISHDDLRLFTYVEKAEEAWEIVADFYDL